MTGAPRWPTQRIGRSDEPATYHPAAAASTECMVWRLKYPYEDSFQICTLFPSFQFVFQESVFTFLFIKIPLGPKKV